MEEMFIMLHCNAFKHSLGICCGLKQTAISLLDVVRYACTCLREL